MHRVSFFQDCLSKKTPLPFESTPSLNEKKLWQKTNKTTVLQFGRLGKIEANEENLEQKVEEVSLSCFSENEKNFPPATERPIVRSIMLVKDLDAQYAGESLDGLADGFGIESQIEGAHQHITYEGEWRSGKFGPYGINTCSSPPVTYRGQFSSQRKYDGLGRLETENVIYEGRWKDNHFDGLGIKADREGSKYEGEFLNGIPHGKGVLYLGDGTTYEGEIDNGNFHGVGVLRYPDGVIYEGEFHNDEFVGVGIRTSFDELQQIKDRYIGEFKNECPHGRGMLIFYPEPNSPGVKMIGKFVEGLPLGEVEYSFPGPRGFIYRGEWKDNRANGMGERKCSNGSMEKGNFKNGRLDGPGIRTLSDGRVLEGNFKEGIYQG